VLGIVVGVAGAPIEELVEELLIVWARRGASKTVEMPARIRKGSSRRKRRTQRTIRDIRANDTNDTSQRDLSEIRRPSLILVRKGLGNKK
jgi:hypothetical protein